MAINMFGKKSTTAMKWNPKKTDYTDAAWSSACAIPDLDGGKLPYKDPDGTINKQGVSSAMKMIGHVKGASAAQLKKAANALKSAAASVGLDSTPKVEELASGEAKKYVSGAVEGTVDWLRGRLQTAVRSVEFPTSDTEYHHYWVNDVFLDGRLIVQDESGYDDYSYYELTWAMDGEGNITLGQPMAVKPDYVTKQREAGSPPAQIEGRITYKDEDERLAYAAVLVPGEPDSDGDVVTGKQSRKVAHGFMDHLYHDFMHEVGDPVAKTVESWCLDEPVTKMFEDGTQITYPADTWMMGVKVDEDYWPAVKSGEITGFSIMAMLEDDIVQMKSANKSVDDIVASFKRTTLKDLEELGEWGVMAVSLVDRPAVGGSKWFALKQQAPKGIMNWLFGVKHGPRLSHDQKDHGNWADGILVDNEEEGGDEAKDDRDGMGVASGDYAPDREIRQKETDKMRDTISSQMEKVGGLGGHKNDLIRAARFLAYMDDDWNNDFFADIPQHLVGEAKGVVAKALEAIGLKLEYTTYEDGSTAPTRIKSRPSRKAKKEEKLPIFLGNSKKDDKDDISYFLSNLVTSNKEVEGMSLSPEAQELVDAQAAATVKALEAVGVIEVKTPEQAAAEKQAEIISQAIASANAPLLEQLGKLQAPAEKTEEESAGEETPAEAIKRMEGEIDRLKKAGTSSKATDSEEDEDEDDDYNEDEEYDEPGHDGRDVNGHRNGPLKEGE